MALFGIKYPILAMDDWLINYSVFRAAAAAEWSEKTLSVEKLLIFVAFLKGFGK
jgi:hypothetical protein